MGGENSRGEAEPVIIVDWLLHLPSAVLESCWQV
jgi:hypothetical protein